MTNKKYDLIALGCSMTSEALVAYKKKFPESTVAVIDPTFAPTCPTRGCIPKKHVFERVKRFVELQAEMEHGFIEGELQINFNKMLADAKPKIRSPATYYENMFTEQGIDVYKHKGEFISKNQVKAGDSILTFDKCIVATGSTPRVMKDTSGHNLPTSNDFFELEELPQKVVIYGAGYIAQEIGTFLALLGSDVTLCYRGDESGVLKEFERSVVSKLLETEQTLPFSTGKRSFTRLLNTSIDEVEHKNNMYYVKTKDSILEADFFLNATGRVPNTNIGLEKAEVEYVKTGIVVDNKLQTSNPTIYAAGDVVSHIRDGPISPKLTTTGGYEGSVISDNLLGGNREINEYDFATITFGFPQVGSVGLRTQDVKDTDNYIVISKEINGFLHKDSKSLSPWFFTVIIEKDSLELKGVHVLGYNIEGDIGHFRENIANNLSFKKEESSFYRKDPWPGGIWYDVMQMLSEELSIVQDSK